MNRQEIVHSTLELIYPESLAHFFEPSVIDSSRPEFVNPLGLWRRTRGDEW